MNEQITADQLLHDPKYRGMSQRDLKRIIVSDNFSETEAGTLHRILGDNSFTALSERLFKYFHPLTPKQMKKEDIKHPYVLVLRDGNKVYVRPSDNEQWIASNTLRGISYSSIAEDLTSIYSKKLDIMHVLDHDGTVLWEREEKKMRIMLFEENALSYEHALPISAEKAERIKKIIEE